MNMLRSALLPLSLSLLVSGALAQPAETPAEPAVEAPAAEPSAAASESAAPAPAPVKPIPAVMGRHVERGLLLAIARAGKQLTAVGGNGVIVTSPDGSAWKQIESPVDVALTAVAFADDQRGWIVGHDALILGTEDGGKSWKIQSAQPDLYSPLFGVQPIAPGRALAVGAFGLMKITEDDGRTWRDVETPDLNAQKFHFNTVTRLRSGKLLVAGEQGLIGTSDDGLAWKRLNPVYEGSFFGALPWGERGAIVFGMRGNAFVATDVDLEDWKKLDLGTTASFFGGQPLADGRVLLTGGEGRLLVIGTDATVKSVTVGGQNMGQASSFTGANAVDSNLIVVGDNGVAKVPMP